MPDEPDIIVQSTVIATRRERDEWVREQNALAAAAGCHYGRASYDEVTRRNLVEYWRERPADMGKPRYQPVASIRTTGARRLP